tara:strand:- start:2143 stop:2484 length:342 start_codon:yes stop_codon:yes gene_type:complete
MPLYTYKNPETGEERDIVQSMSEEHIYVDSNGLKWDRVFQIPNASIDIKIDGTKESFMNYTANKKGTLGDLWDASKEASEKRVKQYGHDPVKKDHYKKFEKEKGIKHSNDKSQ